jgi:hypothetical protein
MSSLDKLFGFDVRNCFANVAGDDAASRKRNLDRFACFGDALLESIVLTEFWRRESENSQLRLAQGSRHTFLQGYLFEQPPTRHLLAFEQMR